jgi:hypothetical protein
MTPKLARPPLSLLSLLVMFAVAAADPDGATDGDAGGNGEEPTPPTVVRAPVRVGSAPT